MVESPFEYFDAIYCINMLHRTDRRLLVSKEFLKVWILEKIIFFPWISVPNNWHLWCFLSHILILKEASLKKYKHVLVFEDDVEFVCFDPLQVQEYINTLSAKNWDIFYFGCSFFHMDMPYLKPDTKGLYRVFWWRGTHAIAYSQSFYEVFLSHLNDFTPESIVQKYGAFDAYFSKYIQQEVFAYMPTNVLCKQRESFSDNEKKIINLDTRILNYFIFLKQESLFLVLFKKYIRTMYYFIWKITRKKTDLFCVFSSIFALFKKNIYYNAKK